MLILWSGPCCLLVTVPEPVRATKVAIGHWSPISFWSFIDPSKQSTKPVIASCDRWAVSRIYRFHCFICQFYTYADLNRSMQQKFDQFPVCHRSVRPIHLTGDRILWPQSFCCFCCQLYTYLHNVIDFNINLYFYFKFLLFKTDLMSFCISKLRTDRSLVIGHRSVSNQSVNSRRSVKLLRRIGSRTVNIMQ